MIFFLLIFLIFSFSPLEVQGQQFLVPAYFNSSSDWSLLRETVRQVPVTAIFNPNSGPGDNRDEALVFVLQEFRHSGGKAIGYVSTSYGTRNEADILRDIDRYHQWYSLDGFFIDEMASNASSVDLYRRLYRYIKGRSSGYQVVGNPGTSVPEIYLSDPCADVLVIFENENPENYRLDSWMSRYPKSVAALFHNVNAVEGMKSILRSVVASGAEYIYITSERLPNPWSRLPNYWNSEIEELMRFKKPSLGIQPQDFFPGSCTLQ